MKSISFKKNIKSAILALAIIMLLLGARMEALADEPDSEDITLVFATEADGANLSISPEDEAWLKLVVANAHASIAMTLRSASIQIYFDNRSLSIAQVSRDNTVVQTFASYTYNITTASGSNISYLNISLSDTAGATVAAAGSSILFWIRFNLSQMHIGDHLEIGHESELFHDDVTDEETYEVEDDCEIAFSVLQGDISMNGSVSAYDAAITAQQDVGLIDLSNNGIVWLEIMDSDGDGDIDARDVLEILEEAADADDHNYPVDTAGSNPAPSINVNSKGVLVRIGPAKMDVNGLFVCNIMVDKWQETLSGEFEFQFGPEIQITEIRPAESLYKISGAASSVKNRFGTAKFVFANSKPIQITEGRTIAEIYFQAPPEQVEFPIEMNYAEFDEGKVNAIGFEYRQPVEANGLDTGIEFDPTKPLVVTQTIKNLDMTTALFQNYPNPFNPETWIPFKLDTEINATIRIFSLTGKLVRTLHLGFLQPAKYITKNKAVHWDGRDNYGEHAASGVYFYSLRAGDFFACRKMVILK